MTAIDAVIRVFGLILPKLENRFALFAFLWSLFVADGKSENDGWEKCAISTCNIIRLISIPLFHRTPTEWLYISTISSIFSFVLQKKVTAGIALTTILHTILYFLLMGVSPLTYWNVGKQLFNVLIWPDDPLQLTFKIGMTFAIGTMVLHFLIHVGGRLLEKIRIDWVLAMSLIHPTIIIYMLPAHSNLHILGAWYSLLLTSMKYQKHRVTQALGVIFIFIYFHLLSL